MELFNDDCLNALTYVRKPNLILVDLPYGQTENEWDAPIDLAMMWQALKEKCGVDCTYLFFCTTRFGATLIASRPSWFRYDLVWKKSTSVGFLCANIQPMRTHEMVYVFNNGSGDDVKLQRNRNLRQYAATVWAHIKSQGYSPADVRRAQGNSKTQKFSEFKTSQFSLPTQATYDWMTEEYGLGEEDWFQARPDLKAEWQPAKVKRTYNPQKTKGRPYTTKASAKRSSNYNSPDVSSINTGDRHPMSVLEFKSVSGAIHPTQKPVPLLKWLIRTYSNPGDVVLDFCMGSGSTGVACLETGRRFVGIEMNEAIFKTARSRIILAEMKLDPKKKLSAS